MPKSPTAPSTRTVKQLFALSGNHCAFTNCSTRLVDLNTGSIVGEVCHIKGEKPSAPRYCHTQDDDARHGFDNLILLCNVHHKIVDDNPVEYPVEELSQMKRQLESRLSDKDPVTAAAEEQFATAVTNSFNFRSEINQVSHIFGGQVAHTITNHVGNNRTSIVAIVFLGAVALAGILFSSNSLVRSTNGGNITVVFGQIEICTELCAWEAISRPCRVVAPIRNVGGQIWRFGGPPIGKFPQQNWPMGERKGVRTHCFGLQLFPLA